MTSKHWPRLLPGLCPFIKKNFFRLRRDIPIFVIILFDPHQKKTMYFTDLSLVTHKKNFQVFFKKNFVNIFTCFLCNFYMTSKYWPRLLPGLCPFLKKIFPAFGGTSLFLLLYFLTPIKKSTMYFTDLSLITHKKNFQVFLKKKFVNIFHMFFV